MHPAHQHRGGHVEPDPYGVGMSDRYDLASTLFVSDLDFTLLRSDTTLGATTVHVINELIAAGGLFTYATARSFSSASRPTADLRLTLPAVTYGGSILVDPTIGTPSNVALLHSSVIDAIQRATTTHPTVEPILFSIVEGRDRIRWRPQHSNRYIESFLSTRKGDPRLLPLSHWSNLDPETVFYATLIGSHAALAALRCELAGELDGCFVTLGQDGYNPDEFWLEIYSAGGTKAHAIRRLQTQLGAERLVVFGDNLNDVPMFEIADAGLAVANAVPELLDVATAVIGSNDEDAVATWLAEFAI